MRVWVIVLHYVGVDDTRNCVNSLLGQSHPADRVLVVDNGSADGAALRSELPAVEIVQTGANLGWAGGNNVGLRYALDRGADRLLFINNDAKAEDRLLETLADADRKHPEFGVLGPVVYDLERPDQVQSAGYCFNDPKQSGFLIDMAANSRAADAVTPADVVMGCCLWVRREVVSRIGPFDERFFLIHEESDFCLRALATGFKVGVATEASVFHRGASSFEHVQQETEQPLRPYYDARNLALLIGKNAGAPGDRGRWSSWLEYLRHLYYFHSEAMNRGERRTAKAIAVGAVDALFGRWGAYSDRRRPSAAVLDALLRLAAWRPFGSGSTKTGDVVPPKVESVGSRSHSNGVTSVHGIHGDETATRR